MKKVGKIGAIVLLAICGIASILVLSVQKAKAEGDHIVINEIYAVPTASLEKDWIEIYNPTENNLSLESYFIIDDEPSSKPFYLSEVAAILKSKELLLVKKGDGGFLFNLSSTSEKIYLRHDGNEDDVDSIIYGFSGELPSPEYSKSLSRIPNGIDTEQNAKDFRLIESTPGETNLLPFYTDKIIINEILPEPSNGSVNEYIELFNSGETEIDLKDWRLDDAEGGSSPYHLLQGTKILPKQYYTFCKKDSLFVCDNYGMNISLNDDGDSARLIDPNGDVESMIIYDIIETKNIKGLSRSVFGDKQMWTKALTPGAENIYQQELVDNSSIKLVDIQTAKGLQDGEVVSISGNVTVLPGVLSSQYFYIQDGTSGIQVYLHNKDFPVLSTGQKVEITGEMSTISGERRLKLSVPSDITLLDEIKFVGPVYMTIGNIDQTHIGEVLTTKGTVTRTSGDTFYISDGTREIKVIIRDGTNIDKPKMRQGDTFMVTGVLSSYKGELRILPIDQNDVTILASKDLPLAGPDIFNLKYLILNFATWILFLTQKKKLGGSPRNLQRA